MKGLKKYYLDLGGNLPSQIKRLFENKNNNKKKKMKRTCIEERRDPLFNRGRHL